MFLLFEDEFGTVNLIVSQGGHERQPSPARAEPLLLARGCLERSQEPAAASVLARGASSERDAGGQAEQIRPVINVIVRELAPLERFLPGGVEDAAGAPRAARVHRLPGASPAGGGGCARRRGRAAGRRGRIEACARWRRRCRASRPGADG